MSKEPAVFISYRRNDTKWVAATLVSELKRYLPEVNLFLDVVSIKPGLDFESILNDTLEQADVQLVLIGKSWLTSQDEAGRRRIDLENDWVRAEITRALDRNIRVIPILVDGAEMPSPEFLPTSLKSLSRRQKYSVRFEDHEMAILGILRVLANIFQIALVDLPTILLPTRSVGQSSATGVLQIFEEDSTDNKTLNILAESQLDLGRFGLAKETFDLIARREFKRCCGQGGFPDIDTCRAKYFVGKAKLLQGELQAAIGDFEIILPLIDMERDQCYPLYIRTQVAIARAHLEGGQINEAKSVLSLLDREILFSDQSITAIDLWIAYLEERYLSQKELMSKLDKEIESFPPTIEFALSLAQLKETMKNSSIIPTMIWH